MDYTSIGSLGAYMKNFKLQSKWQQKKETGNYTQKVELQDIQNPDKVTYQRYADKMNEEKDLDLENIRLKMKSGGKLSQTEMEYLKGKDPAAYQKAKELDAERANYERDLKNCKTKEDVQRLKLAHLGNNMSTIQSVMNNPVIPEDKKLEIVMQEHAKVQAVNDAEQEFIESGEYDKLWTEAERNEAIHEEAEAKKEEASGENKGEGAIEEGQEEGRPAEKTEGEDIQESGNPPVENGKGQPETGARPDGGKIAAAVDEHAKGGWRPNEGISRKSKEGLKPAEVAGAHRAYKQAVVSGAAQASQQRRIQGQAADGGGASAEMQRKSGRQDG